MFRGRHSKVYVSGDRAVKIFHPSFRYNFWKEVRYLTVLKPRGFVPRIFDFDPEELRIEMEFVKGICIRDFVEIKDRDEIRRVLEKCLDICHRLDRMRIQKEEMNHPGKHVIIRSEDGRVIFIDFERAYECRNPSNVTQFINYMMSRSLREKVYVRVPPKEVIKDYKESFSFRAYKELKEYLFG